MIRNAVVIEGISAKDVSGNLLANQARKFLKVTDLHVCSNVSLQSVRDPIRSEFALMQKIIKYRQLLSGIYLIRNIKHAISKCHSERHSERCN